MKQLLIGTTALVATASVAAADVTFSGFGRFGVGYIEDRSENSDISDTIIISRLRINIDASTETDSGLKFSARFRMQADEDSDTGEAGNGGINGARFSVEYGNLRTDVGNVSGAIDDLPNYFGAEPGLESFNGQYSAVNYSFLEYTSTGSGANAVYVRYATDAFAVAASYDPTPNDEDRFDIHGSYTFNNITLALAYGSTDNASDDEIVVFTAGADFGPLNATLIIGDEDAVDEDDPTKDIDGAFYGLSLEYDISAATTLLAAYGDGSGDDDDRFYGVGVIHDLGNGVSLRGGVGQTDNGTDDQVRADFGVRFNF